ncbi:MAG: tRNA-Thr(GGU) m(6)t(6)A37 methyltransferase TsaA [Bacteroidia bacterium]
MVSHLKSKVLEIKIRPIATVKNSRTNPIDDNWATVISEIELSEHIPTEALNGILEFSHAEVIYYFDKAKNEDIVFSGRPRGNSNYPLVGIFGQRKKDRPNKIGIATVEVLGRNGRTLTVKYLDAINGTPILDIKPVFKEFQPKTEIKEPIWVADLMKGYWK